jgi:hypothetical protein
MILLTSTSDKIQLITSAAGSITCHASYADASGSPVTVTLGRTNSLISSAATTDVVPAPGSSTSRNVKQLKISNTHASVSNTVTIQHTDGSTACELEKVTLLPGERMGYEEGVGIRVFDVLGREKTAPGQGYPGAGSTADITLSSAETYLLGLPVAGRLTIGSTIKWQFRASKTGAGVAAAICYVKFGTAGTTSDTARITHTFSAIQTAVTDQGLITVLAEFRAVGASAVISSVCDMASHLSADAAGLGTCRAQQVTSSTFDSTPNGSIISLTCNPGASAVWTAQFVSVEAYGLTA